MSRLKQLIREVHRRSMWQVLGIYVVGAWLAYQVILGLTEGGILPEWFPGVAVGLFIIGLPLVLATAFVQEGVGGSDRTERPQRGGTDRPDPPPGEPADRALDQDVAAPEDGAVGIDRFLTWRTAIAAGVFAFVFAGLIALTASVLGPESGDTEADRERSIAVLPLENMSPNPDDEYFTDGIHEEIITRLFRIGQIRTLARASVMGFRATERPLPEIADALGVNFLLVGSVRRSGDRSRVSVSLIAPRSGEQLWADTYEATGTDVFAVQASIAENVASELEAELTAGTRDRLATLPTVSAEAYDDYLRARDAQSSSYGEVALERALELYERAVERDPDFALAHAHLGVAHTQAYWFHFDHTEERLRRARRHIDRALELDPDLPEAHLAMGRFHYWGRLDYDQALEELDIAARALPSDPEISLTRASVYRRAGRWEQAIDAYRHTTNVDPRFWEGWWNLAETYWLMRRFDDAIEAAERAAAVGLGATDVWVLKATIRLRGLGRPRAALTTLDSVPAELAEGEYEPTAIRALAHVYLRQYDRVASDAGSTVLENQFLMRPTELLRALAHRFAGDESAARAAFDSARIVLERRRADAPDDVRILGALALARAGLGQGEQARQLARRALDLLPPEAEAWRGAVRVEELAMVQAMTGRYDEAIQNVEWLLTNPSAVTVAELRLNPMWDPLRELPDFQALLERHGASRTTPG